MGALAGEFIGRDQELALLEDALAALDQDSGAVVDISGEPGVGKTRLLDELCNRAEARGYLVLDGRATELEQDLPFDPFVDALDDYLTAIDRRRLAGLDAEVGHELAAVFPALSDLREDRGGPPRAQHYLAHQAVRALLEELAHRQPLVLVLDDLHWADGGSVELISHLLRRMCRGPILLALAYRSAQAPSPLARALEAAAREGRGERIELAPLSREEAGQLLGRNVEAARLDELYRDSGGNPFYLEELAGARTRSRHHPDPEPPAIEGDTVPAAVRMALVAEIEALSGPARTLASAAAVAGEPFEPTLVGAVAETPEDETLALLDELLGADLIRPTTVPRFFSFRHPIVRHAVYASATKGWLIAAHRRAAAALAARGVPPTRRAHHVERSASEGDEEAIALLVEAGDETAGHAPATAAHWFEAALRLVPRADEQAERCVAALVAQARALAATGQLERARDALEGALALVPPEWPGVRTSIVAGLARIDGVLGDHGRARRRLDSALAEMADKRSPEAIDLKLELGGNAFYVGDFAAMRRWAAEAFEQTESQGDRSLQAAAGTLMGGAEYMTGRVGEARALVSRTAGLIDGMPDAQLAARLGSVVWLGWCEVFLEHFGDAEVHLKRGLDVAAATGQNYPLALLHLPRAAAFLWQGRIAEAEAAIDAATEASLLSEAGVFLSWALAMRCWSCVLRGDLQAAIGAGEEAVQVAGAPNDVLKVLAPCYLAEARLEAGEPERCRHELLAGAGGSELPLFERAFRPHWYEVLTRAELELGRLEAAEDWAARAEAAADGMGIDGRTAEVLRARAALLLARGEAASAAEAALASAAAAQRPGNRIDVARARTLAGRAFADACQPERAVDELRRAEAELAACGAGRYRAEAALALRGLGGRVAPRARRGAGDDGVAALSGREREVAELLTAGKTNRQIAAELYVSEKTVATHVAHIFTKLGVRSRAAVAAEIARTEPARG